MLSARGQATFAGPDGRGVRPLRKGLPERHPGGSNAIARLGALLFLEPRARAQKSTLLLQFWCLTCPGLTIVFMKVGFIDALGCG
eukprot:COSAG01_NODE_5885_length_3970_cov_16.893051_4_plen_85_part_00